MLSIDNNGKVVKFEEKPKEPESTLISTGIYFFTKDSLKMISEYIDGGKNVDSPGYFIKWLSEKRDVYASVERGRWYDIGTWETYQEALKDFS